MESTSEKVFTLLIDDKKNVLFKGFQFKNTLGDATKLLEKIATYPEVEIGMETTGHYCSLFISHQA